MKNFELLRCANECYLVKYYQSEDESVNGAIFDDMDDALDYFTVVARRGFMPQIEFFYRECMVPKKEKGE